MAENRWHALVLAVMMAALLLPVGSVSAEMTTEERLEAEGLTVLALRNDTIDSNQDGDIDAVRVVVILNSTAASNELIVKLRGLHKEREVLETQEVAFSGQTNITVVYDAWSKGEHDLRLDFLDANGEFIASYPLPTFMLTPALQVPRVQLSLNAGDSLQTGELCEITRTFADETGPRYGETGVRTFTGAPFSVLDSHETLDCASWPAGDYELKETYRNGLGQTAESTLNFTIQNRPAPAFKLLPTGHENTTETPCSVRMELTDGRPLDGLTMVWRVKGDVVEGANSTVLDCSNLAAGAYLIALEVQTDKQITSTQAINLIRLPAADLTADERASFLPPRWALRRQPSPLDGCPSVFSPSSSPSSSSSFSSEIPNLNHSNCPRLARRPKCWPTVHPIPKAFPPPWTTKGRFGANILPGRWTGGTESGASGTGGSRWNSQKRC